MQSHDIAESSRNGPTNGSHPTLLEQLESAENEGMPSSSRPQRGSAAPKPGAAQATSLERRVLAHERILQSLIAHMSELDPRYMERLKSVFIAPLAMKQHEHDYTETEDFAAEFIRAIEIISQAVPSWTSRIPDVAEAADRVHGERNRVVGFFTPTLFMIRQRGNLWELLVDGHPYGNFLLESEALDAATRAARRIASRGPVEVRDR